MVGPKDYLLVVARVGMMAASMEDTSVAWTAVQLAVGTVGM